MHTYRDPHPSPLLPRVCVGWAGRAARALTTLASASVLAVGALALAPAPARAEDVITTQEYFSYYHLDTARAKGYTGKGVTIALIDGPIDTNAPELKGANITDKSRCTVEEAPSGLNHGTALASILVSQNYGVAPDAMLYLYQASDDDSLSGGHVSSVTKGLIATLFSSTKLLTTERRLSRFQCLLPTRVMMSSGRLLGR